MGQIMRYVVVNAKWLMQVDASLVVLHRSIDALILFLYPKHTLVGKNVLCFLFSKNKDIDMLLKTSSVQIFYRLLWRWP